MLISILTCVYNDERFIAKSIESILTQSYLHFRYVIIDDGSTDRTPEILASFASHDKRIRIFRQTNQGPAQAKNKGIELLDSEFIVFQDSDDISLPERLANIVNQIEKDDADVITSNYEVIDENGSVICSFQKDANISERIAVGRNPICHGATAFRRSMIKMAGGFNPYYKNAEDYDLYLRLLDINARFIKMDRLLYQYRIRRNSVMATTSNSYREIAYQNFKRRKNKKTEYFPDIDKFNPSRLPSYDIRFAEALFWSENYSKFRHFYFTHFSLLVRRLDMSIFLFFSLLPEGAKNNLKKLLTLTRQNNVPTILS